MGLLEGGDLFALVLGQVGRQLDEDAAVLVAGGAALVLDTAAADAETFAAADAGGNVQIDVALDGRHRDGGALSGLRQRDRQVKRNVIALAPEEGVWLNMDDDEQIAAFAGGAGLALAAGGDGFAVFDAGGILTERVSSMERSGVLRRTSTLVPRMACWKEIVTG